jgi:hypothetical protein
MAEEIISDDVRNFILRHIDSVAQLEALLLLRANPGESWDVAKIAKRLYAKEQEVTELLERLCADRLLSCEGQVFRYDCRTPEQQNTVERVAEFYARHLIPVTNMIHAKPRRIREFADAFKFRRDR